MAEINAFLDPVASMIVKVLGAVFVGLLVWMFALNVWRSTSKCAKQMKLYLQDREDYRIYKQDFAEWDERMRRQVDKMRQRADQCKHCAYRMEYQQRIEAEMQEED